MRDEALHEELARLRARASEAEECCYGLLQALVHVLPPLLQGHPGAARVQAALQRADDRYELLVRQPQLADHPGETHHRYEAQMQLNRLLAMQGVWPGVDPRAVSAALVAQRTAGS